MLMEILEIQKWFKDNIGEEVPDGKYVIPIKGVKYNIEIIEQKIWIKDKFKEDVIK